MAIKRMRYCNIALNKYKRKGKSELALLEDTWSPQVANGFRGPYSCLPHEYVRLIYVSWLWLCFLQLALGIVLFIVNSINTTTITDSDNSYLFFQHTYHETTHLIIYGESALLILSAAAGVLLSYHGFPSAHIRNVQAAFYICFICTLATIWLSISLQHWPDKTSYLRNLEAEAHHRGDNVRFQTMWKNKHWKDNIWDAMHKDLRCCGYRGYMDWVNSPCKCIPASCCRDTHFPECWTLLSTPQKQIILPDDAKNLSYIVKNLIWTDGCQVKLEKKFINEKKFWILFPTIFVCIQFLILTLQAWITGKTLYYITCVPGARIQMDIFKGRFHLLANYKALIQGIEKLEDPYQIVLHDHPFNAESFKSLNSRTFIIMSTPDEFTSLEIVRPSDHQLQKQIGANSGKRCVSHCDSWVQTSAYMWANPNNDLSAAPDNKPELHVMNVIISNPVVQSDKDPANKAPPVLLKEIGKKQ